MCNEPYCIDVASAVVGWALSAALIAIFFAIAVLIVVGVYQVLRGD